jgi:hypothetical protein
VVNRGNKLALTSYFALDEDVERLVQRAETSSLLPY